MDGRAARQKIARELWAAQDWLVSNQASLSGRLNIHSQAISSAPFTMSKLRPYLFGGLPIRSPSFFTLQIPAALANALRLFLGASDQPKSPCLTTDWQATGLWRSASANWMSGVRGPLGQAIGQRTDASVRSPARLAHCTMLA